MAASRKGAIIGPAARGAAVILAGAVLAACAAQPQPAPRPVSVMPGAGYAAPPLASTEPAPSTDLRPDLRPAPPPDRLDGLTGEQLRAALGAPGLLREEGPAQLWQYIGNGCVLHVFLFRENGVYRVKRAETRIDDPSVSSPPTCVAWKSKPVAHGEAAAGPPS